MTADVGPLDRESTEAGIVKSLNDAIPAFVAYYERYPLRWDRLHHLYYKFTLFVILRVEQDQQGHWLAYRDDYPMLRHGKPAHFATCTDAKRAADAHELDLYPNAKPIDDGLSWLPDPEIDWRSIPYLTEEDANWRRSSSHLIVWQSNGDATTSSSI